MKTKITAALAVLITSATFSSAAMAAGGMDVGDMYTKCGIGGAIFKHTTWAAASSNIIFDLGTTAVISGLSSPETCQGNKVKTAMLINDSYAQIESEAAQGEGPTLVALEQVSGCSTANLRSDLANASVTEDRAARVKTIYNSVMGTCKM